VEYHETNHCAFLKRLLIVLSHVFFLLPFSSDDESLRVAILYYGI